MNTELQTKILQVLEKMHGAQLGPILLASLAASLGVEARQVSNTLDSMRKLHQVKHQTNKGWVITGVGRRVLGGYTPAPKKVKTKPRLTKPVKVHEAPAPAPVVQRARTTHVAIVVDRSGSMSHCAEGAQDAVNKLIKQLAEKSKDGMPTTITLVTFDDRIDVVYMGVAAEAAGQLHLMPRDRTALFDAANLAVDKLGMLAHDSNTAYLVTVITDGQENCSADRDGTHFGKNLASLQATDRWTFSFLVPDLPGKNALMQRGVPAGNITTWTATEAGAKEMGAVAAVAVDNYYAVRSAGGTSSRSFFQPDLSALTPADLAKLTDIRGRCYLWSIDQEAVIQPFVEAKLGHYQPGMGYYPLTKKETVQAFKQVALVDRKSGAIYAGIEARQLLKLPAYEVKVEPGNHAGFDIYIQSTSNNRKLVRGSKLLYMK